MPELSDQLETHLLENFGYRQFRPGQRQVIEMLLDGKSSLAIFPTGSGKSLCYQLSAQLLPHLTLVVSPLLALMKDQLDFLTEQGIAAARIDSTMSSDEHKQVVDVVRSGETKILMVSVERFKNERFRQFISNVAISLLVVDEAHCISEWGHNFRPDYLKLPAYQQQLGLPPVLLLTATATASVKADMMSKFSLSTEQVVQTGFYRANLDLAVESIATGDKPAHCCKLIQQFDGAGIVYVTLQHQADELAAYLAQHQIRAVSYHAGLGDDKRQQIQQRFMDDQVQVVVATIAFGMGIDKSNIRFVIHYELPKSIEGYSQEIGRAGRDGKLSHCVTFADLNGVTTLENFVYGDTPEEHSIDKLINEIQTQSSEHQWETQLHKLSGITNIRQLPLKTLLVQLELMGVITPSYSYFAQFRLRFVRPAEQILASFDVQRRLFLKDIFACSPVKKVWAEVDVEAFECRQPDSRSRLVAALEYLHERGWIELQSKLHTDVYKVNKPLLHQPQLAKRLKQYVLQKETAEIQRIEDMVAFFQSKDCISATLAKHFDDPEVPLHCGHCSVCRGQYIEMCEPSYINPFLAQQIDSALLELANKVETKLGENLSLDLACRFFMGISSPFLTRLSARQLNGFGQCAKLPYRQVRKQLEQTDVFTHKS